jgi:thiol-disulfide isomerase/thioredoxin
VKPAGSAARSWRLAFWVLVVLSTLTVAVALWRWQERRAQIAEQARPSSSDVSGAAAPDFALVDLDGQMVALSEFRGRVVLLNFWATWCPPCEAEMPDLDALHQRYGEQHGLVVIGVNQKEAADVVLPFVQTRRLSFPILLDLDGQVALRRFAVRGLPMSFIIDREGVIRDAWPGRIAREAMVVRLERVW